MGKHTRLPEPKAPPAPCQLDVIEVDRDFIAERGWPRDFDVLRAFTGSDPRVRLVNVAEADLIAWSGKDIAWFRRGDEGQALLYQQGWRGPLRPEGATA